MRSSIRENRETPIAAGRSGGRASMILLAVVAILGVCTVLACLVSEPQPSAAEQEAKAALEELGCHLITHPETGHVDFVSFRRGSDVDDATAEKLAGLPYLLTLDVSNCSITDEQLRHLSDLPELTWLCLGGTRISDDGLAYLADSLDLTGLSLRDTEISNEGLRHVARMRDLRALDVRNTLVTQQALKHLADLDNLRWLWITEITDAGVDHLMQMNNLEGLWVNENHVGKEKLKQLEKALPGLFIDNLQAP